MKRGIVTRYNTCAYGCVPRSTECQRRFATCTRRRAPFTVTPSMSSVAAVSTRTNGSPSSTSHRNAWQMCQSGNLQSPTSCWTATCNHGLRSARCCTTNTRGRCGVPAGDRVLGRRAPLVRGRLSRTQWWRRATNARHPAQRSRTRLHKHCYRNTCRTAYSIELCHAEAEDETRSEIVPG